VPPSFSPDSQRLAYGAQDENGSQFVVVDWQPQTKYYGIPPSRLRFSDDSKHLAYFASKRVLRERPELPERGWVRLPQDTFYVLVVQMGSSGATTRERQLDGGPVTGASIVWDTEKQLHVMVGDGKNFGSRIAVQTVQLG